MPSIGDAELQLDSRIVGSVRVTQLYAGSAIYPRLCLQVEVSLQDVPDETGKGAPDTRFEVRDIDGELRLSAHADVIGQLQWAGERRSLRSSRNGYSGSIAIACDLDHFRLELIEKRRNGKAPRLWVHLWPAVAFPGRDVQVRLQPFELRIEREQWHEFLAKVGGHEYELVEVHYGPGERDHFKRGLERVREARAQLLAGDYDGAVSTCRKVLEASGHDLVPGKSDSALKELFVRATDEKRGGEYSSMVSRVKQLAALAHHDLGAPLVYSRAEAQFVVRVTESLLSLASHFAAGAAPDTNAVSRPAT